MAESTRIMTSASNVASGLENNNRDLIDKNVQLKGALANTYSKVIDEYYELNDLRLTFFLQSQKKICDLSLSLSFYFYSLILLYSLYF